MKKNDKDIYLELLNIIKDKQDEGTKVVLELDKKLDLHIQKTEIELSSINKLDQEQNKLLENHIKRTALLEKSLEEHKFDNFKTFKDFSDKIVESSKPLEFLKLLSKLVLLIGGLSGSLYALYRILELI